MYLHLNTDSELIAAIEAARIPLPETALSCITIEEFRASKCPAQMSDILDRTGATDPIRGWIYGTHLLIVETANGYEWGWHMGGDDIAKTVEEAEEGLYRDYVFYA
ncbi:MAG: hypothetical protein DI537_13945 [Stutzerimonas stutzeri]|nr:MAG: hypothetical protein DI537_13945 [Stutzerimonas stutzeri]